MKLHNFFRSGTSHRLRIALRLKGLDPDYVAVDLRREQHLSAAFKAINPQGMVPALETQGKILTQTPAIIEWLEEACPTPALLPKDIGERAHVRALAALVGCDIHPLGNRRVLEYLRKNFAADEASINAWCGTWISAGFDALRGAACGVRAKRPVLLARRADARRRLSRPSGRKRPQVQGRCGGMAANRRDRRGLRRTRRLPPGGARGATGRRLSLQGQGGFSRGGDLRIAAFLLPAGNSPIRQIDHELSAALRSY